MCFSLRPEGKLVVTSKIDLGDNNIKMYKALFVSRGFSQQEGEDYDKTLAPLIIRSIYRTTMIH
jgi:hypothetical protein